MTAPPLFDGYVMVDWSAAATPRRGKDSVWLCHLRRAEGKLGEVRLENPPTRLEARALLLELLADELAAGRRILAGFDFPFGYPTGFAARLDPAQPDWRGVWAHLAARIAEQGGNANNRFEIAAEINRRVGGGGPFWGCPAGSAYDGLAMTHHRRHDALGLAEKRLAEMRIKGPQPVWKLAGVGSAGSQALTGIPMVEWLRQHPRLATKARVWPFETGLTAPPDAARIIFAEIYPSLVPIQPRAGQVKDRAQVRAIARHFAGLDAAGRLAQMFAGDPALSPEERRRVEQEESWILGVAASAEGSAYDYLRDPQAIYRESFARIRAEVDLTRFPAELHALMLRLVHAVGEPEIARDLVWSEGAAEIGRAALAAGAPLLVDAEMVAAGIITRHLPRGNRVLCRLGDRRVPALARRLGTTRSAAAVELWRPDLAGAIAVIGNAPTALYHLLEMVAGGGPRPALVLGFPVGFVGAAEAKQALAENPLGLDFIALAGRRGGSALAAAAVNALAAGEIA